MACLSERTAGGDENRALVKLPTGKRDPDENLSEIFEDNLLVVFFIPWAILTRWADCKAEALVKDNVNSAHLDFDVLSGAPGAGEINASLMSKAWWHTANWERAHPFSGSDGGWSAGAEVYDGSTFTPIPNDMNSGGVRYDITDYFKQLIEDEEAENENRTPHYGFRLDAAAAPYAEVRLKSVQTPLSNDGPRIVVDYDTTGTCGESSFPDFGTPSARTERMLVVTPLKPGARRYLIPVGGDSGEPAEIIE